MAVPLSHSMPPQRWQPPPPQSHQLLPPKMPHPPLLAQQQYPYRLPPGTSPNASESGPPPDQLRDQQQMGGGGEGGKRNRRPLQRKTIDYYGAVVRALETRIMTGTGNCQRFRFATPCVADPSYIIDLAPPRFIPFSEAVANLPTRLVQQAQNKARCPVNVIRWTPEGRRLLTGSSSGEFTMWNGLTFNFETIMQAHDKAVRAMEWSHNGKWLVSGDHEGMIKYWLPNLSNVKPLQGHQNVIRDLSFCPTDEKFVSASDDGTLKIWDFSEAREEGVLSGHGWDVRCVDWHPQKGLLASGSKDNTVKLWDPRSGGRCLRTLHGHHNTVQQVGWNKNGNWLLSAGRDQSIRVYDIRKMVPMHVYRTVYSEVSSLVWHPFSETLFASGCSKDMARERMDGGVTEGVIQFWQIGEKEDVGSIPNAHSSYIWSLAWHPFGHVLASGSNDHSTRFWARARPGDGLDTEIKQARLEEVDAVTTEATGAGDMGKGVHPAGPPPTAGVGGGGGDNSVPGLAGVGGGPDRVSNDRLLLSQSGPAPLPLPKLPPGLNPPLPPPPGPPQRRQPLPPQMPPGLHHQRPPPPPPPSHMRSPLPPQRPPLPRMDGHQRPPPPPPPPFPQSQRPPGQQYNHHQHQRFGDLPGASRTRKRQSRFSPMSNRR